MKTLQTQLPWLIQDRTGELSVKQKLMVILTVMLALFLLAGRLLQTIDPTAGILDIGVLSVLLFGLLGGCAAILVSLWLQELLWKPFKLFRKQFFNYFNQLTSWQQCKLYFSVFFLLLYAVLYLLNTVL